MGTLRAGERSPAATPTDDIIGDRASPRREAEVGGFGSNAFDTGWIDPLCSDVAGYARPQGLTRPPRQAGGDADPGTDGHAEPSPVQRMQFSHVRPDRQSG